jgi:hypothetical protein
MTMAYKIQTDLTEFWANFDFDKPPYIHPSDQATRMLAEEDFLSGIIDLDTFVDSADYGKKKSTLLLITFCLPRLPETCREEIFSFCCSIRAST